MRDETRERTIPLWFFRCLGSTRRDEWTDTVPLRVCFPGSGTGSPPWLFGTDSRPLVMTELPHVSTEGEGSPPWFMRDSGMRWDPYRDSGSLRRHSSCSDKDGSTPNMSSSSPSLFVYTDYGPQPSSNSLFRPIAYPSRSTHTIILPKK